MQHDDFDVSEVVGLLADFAPQELERLRDNFPELRKFLFPGVVAGPAPSISSDPRALTARVDLQRVGLLRAIELSTALLNDSRQRSVLARRVEMMGHVAALVAGAYLLLLGSSGSDWEIRLCGALSLGGAAVGLLFHHKLTPSSGVNGKDVSSQIASERDVMFTLLETFAAWNAAASSSDNERDIRVAIRTTNSVTRRLRKRISTNGGGALASQHHLVERSQNPHQALRDFLCQRFNRGELIEFVLLLESGTQIRDALPAGDGVSMRDLAFQLVEYLVRHKRIDAVFWRTLRTCRPYVRVEVHRLEMLFVAPAPGAMPLRQASWGKSGRST